MCKRHSPRYPHVCVLLSGSDGNAFAILGRVQRAMREHDVSEPEIREFFKQATAGDYQDLLRVVHRWVGVE